MLKLVLKLAVILVIGMLIAVLTYAAAPIIIAGIFIWGLSKR